MTSIAKHFSLISKRRLFLAFLFLLLANLAFAILANAQTLDMSNENPMESKYSQEIRNEYKACRELESPVAQYLCTCRVLEKQCRVPRKDLHGNWNTVEYWPTEDPADREVQFILLMKYDSLGDFSPDAFGVVYTCMAGEADLHVFLGDDVDQSISPIVFIGDDEVEGEILEDDGRFLIEFFNKTRVFNTLETSKNISVIFEDFDGNENFLEFDSRGFANVSKGWEPVCSAKSLETIN